MNFVIAIVGMLIEPEKKREENCEQQHEAFFIPPLIHDFKPHLTYNDAKREREKYI